MNDPDDCMAGVDPLQEVACACELRIEVADALPLRVREQRVYDTGHGRVQRRELQLTGAVAGKPAWTGLAQGFRLERWAREKPSGKERQEVV